MSEMPWGKSSNSNMIHGQVEYISVITLAFRFNNQERIPFTLLTGTMKPMIEVQLAN